MKGMLIFLSVLVLIVISGPAHADMYQWVDENGVMHFSNAPTDISSEDQIRVMGETESTYVYDEAQAQREYEEYIENINTQPPKQKNIKEKIDYNEGKTSDERYQEFVENRKRKQEESQKKDEEDMKKWLKMSPKERREDFDRKQKEMQDKGAMVTNVTITGVPEKSTHSHRRGRR